MSKHPEKVSVFVYGTLMPGGWGYQRYCAAQVVQACPVIARGQLYHLPAGYPAMTQGKGWVHGYLLQFSDHKILATLDRYEGYVESGSTHNFYDRQQLEVFDQQTQFLDWAWAYFMTPTQVSNQGGILLPQGQWDESNR